MYLFSLKESCLQNQIEGMGLLGYQAMTTLRDVAHDGVLCTFSNSSALDGGKRDCE